MLKKGHFNLLKIYFICMNHCVLIETTASDCVQSSDRALLMTEQLLIWGPQNTGERLLFF